jgi:hypothetical protein
MALASIVIAAPTARAQGNPQQQFAITESVLKAMIAQKPKTKTPLTARIAAMRRPAQTRSSQVSTPTPPATVTEIRKTSRK